jgi:hypothetical protein
VSFLWGLVHNLQEGVLVFAASFDCTVLLPLDEATPSMLISQHVLGAADEPVAWGTFYTEL